MRILYSCFCSSYCVCVFFFLCFFSFFGCYIRKRSVISCWGSFILHYMESVSLRCAIYIAQHLRIMPLNFKFNAEEVISIWDTSCSMRSIIVPYTDFTLPLQITHSSNKPFIFTSFYLSFSIRFYALYTYTLHTPHSSTYFECKT